MQYSFSDEQQVQKDSSSKPATDVKNSANVPSSTLLRHASKQLAALRVPQSLTAYHAQSFSKTSISDDKLTLVERKLSFALTGDIPEKDSISLKINSLHLLLSPPKQLAANSSS